METDNQLCMDKIYIKQYNIRLNQDKLSLSKDIRTALVELHEDIPKKIFDTISGFIPHITDDETVKIYSWKIFWRVSRTLEIIDTEKWNIYFFSIKSWNFEDLTKKWGTLVTVWDWKTLSAIDLENNEKLLYEFYVGFTILDNEKDGDDVIIPIRMYFIKRWRMLIDSQIKLFLEKCFHESTINEVIQTNKRSLREFKEKISEIELKWIRKKKQKDFGGKTEVIFNEKISIDIEKPKWETIQSVFQSKDDNLLHIMNIESANATIEDNDNISHKVLLNLDKEEFQRNLMIELEWNILSAANTISKDDFKKIVQQHKEWIIRANNQSELNI